MHYSQLQDLPTSCSSYNKLRATIDSAEKNLRSLQSPIENIQNNMIVSLLKLPRDVITRLEKYRSDKDGREKAWDLKGLREFK